MKTFNATHKGNGKNYIIRFDGNSFFSTEVGTEIEKQITEATIKRWYEIIENPIQEEIQESKVIDNALAQMIEIIMAPEKKKGNRKRAQAIEKIERTDKFRPKLTFKDAEEIRSKYVKGEKRTHIAKEFQVSYTTVDCIIKGKWFKETDKISEMNISA